MKEFFQLSDLQLRILEKENIECDDITALLGDLADNELPPTLKTRVLSHVAECDICQEEVDSYHWVISLTKELKDVPMPSDVSKRLRERLNKSLGIALPIR